MNQNGNVILVIILVIVVILIILLWLIKTNSITYNAGNPTFSPSPQVSILDDFSSLSDLNAEEASKLYMPNAFTLDDKKLDGPKLTQLQLDSSATEKKQGIEGIEPATCCHVALGTQATQQDVFNFYNTELKKLGWVSTKYDVFQTTTETKIYGWCKPKRLFRLGFFDKKEYAYDPKIGKDWNYITYFTTYLTGESSSARCP